MRKKVGFGRRAFYIARYKNFEIKIDAQVKGFGSEIEGYYFLAVSEKYDVTFNSLWKDSSFGTIEEAQTAAVEWIDNMISQL